MLPRLSLVSEFEWSLFFFIEIYEEVKYAEAKKSYGSSWAVRLVEPWRN